jgi:hypothetical protein
MSCECTNLPGSSASAVFDHAWPVGLAFPPRVPWLASFVTRGAASRLLQDGDPSPRGLTIPPDSDRARGGESDCQAPDCDGFCGTVLILSDEAARLCEEGGFSRMLIEALYFLVAHDLCAYRCEAEKLREDCRLADYCIYKGVDRDTFELIWVCKVQCCCSVVEETIPGGPLFVPGIPIVDPGELFPSK